MIQGEFTKEIGRMIFDLGSDMKSLKMETYITESFFTAKPMEMESILGQMERCSKVNGSMD